MEWSIVLNGFSMADSTSSSADFLMLQFVLSVLRFGVTLTAFVLSGTR